MPRRGADAHESKLTPRIARVLAWCLENPTRRRKDALPNGMSYTVYIDTDNRRHVCLARRGSVGPSLQEAQTVLKHWPEPVPEDVKWKPAQLGPFAVLVSIWEAPPPPPEQLSLGGTR